MIEEMTEEMTVAEMMTGEVEEIMMTEVGVTTIGGETTVVAEGTIEVVMGAGIVTIEIEDMMTAEGMMTGGGIKWNVSTMQEQEQITYPKLGKLSFQKLDLKK